MVQSKTGIITESETRTVKKNISGRKIVLRAAIFIIIAALLFVYLNEVFTIADSDSNKKVFSGFYAQREDSLDAVYLGTSATNRYFISTKAYGETGMAIYNLAVMGMPLFFIPNLIEEVEKTQNPSLYIIELRGVLKDKNMITDAHIRRITDSMKYSANRTAAINKALEFTEGAEGELSNIDDSALDYYVPIIKYHSRLESGDLSYKDVLLRNSRNKTKGFVYGPKTLTRVAQDEAYYSDERTELAADTAEELEDILDYCDGLAQDVLFVMAPYSVKEGQAEKFNTAIDMVTARGYEVINFNTPEMIETLGINWKKDFYNSKHVNFVGAEKYTDYLTEYLAEHYDLPDHRGDEDYESWETSHQMYLDYISVGIGGTHEED